MSALPSSLELDPGVQASAIPATCRGDFKVLAEVMKAFMPAVEQNPTLLDSLPRHMNTTTIPADVNYDTRSEMSRLASNYAEDSQGIGRKSFGKDPKKFQLHVALTWTALEWARKFKSNPATVQLGRVSANRANVWYENRYPEAPNFEVPEPEGLSRQPQEETAEISRRGILNAMLARLGGKRIGKMATQGANN